MQDEELKLLTFDEGWARRTEATLPKLMVLLAAATGNDSKYDGTVHLTPSLRFNARVAKGPKYEISQGAVLAILETAYLLANDPDFYVLEYPFEDKPRDIVDFGVVQRFYNYTQVDSRSSLPLSSLEIDSGRVGIFSRVFLYGLSYLLLHEQGHFVQGHLGYASLPHAVVEWFEASDANKHSHIDPLTSRALEWDADAFAGTTHFFAMVAPGKQSDQPLTREWLLGQEKELILSWAGAVATSGLLCVADRSVTRTVSERRHPSSAYRTMTLLVALDTFLQECGFNEDESDDLIARAIKEGRIVYRHFGVMDELASALLCRAGKLSNEHPLHHERISIIRRRNQIESDLERYRQEVLENFPLP